MPDVAELHGWVANYNWDDGVMPMWPIVKSGKTEFATALLIYWRLAGPWLKESAGEYNAEAKRLQEFVENGLLTGRYPKTTLRYDPVSDNRLSRVQVHRLKKAGVPKELVEPEYPFS